MPLFPESLLLHINSKNEYGEMRCIAAFLAQMPTKIIGSCMFRDIEGQT